jgi:Flp pilus assembly protein TadG
MKIFIKQWIEDIRGAALIEAAIFFPLLLIVYFGMIEITQYISTREMVNRYANSVANISIGATTTAMQTDAQNAAIAMAPIMLRGSSPRTSFRFCSWNTTTNSYNCPLTVNIPGSGKCGYGDVSGASSTVTGLTVPAGVSRGYRDIMVMVVQCQYAPMFNVMGLFGGATRVDVGTPANPYIVPLRRS